MNSQKIAIIGTGYVGLVTGACFAKFDHQITCVDNNPDKINLLNQGKVPFYEPGLEELVRSGRERGNLRFTSDLSSTVDDSLVSFICVGTPSAEDGSADLTAVFNVAREIGKSLTEYKVIVDKSTVPVGTAELVEETIRGQTISSFDVVSNPEFLAEGRAVEDFLKPDRVVIGARSEKARDIMLELYRPLMLSGDRTLLMSPEEAEMAKYAANAALATKISFMNDLARLCDKLHIDVDSVRKAMCADNRIGPKFYYPGAGYGGSCFPKDVKALACLGEKAGHPLRIISAVEAVNHDQKEYLAEKIVSTFRGDVSRNIFAVWGLSFKPETDDIREAPALSIIKYLQERGAKIRAHDPQAMNNVRQLNLGIQLYENKYTALEEADGLILVTEWTNYRNPDWQTVKEKLKQPNIFDGRNIYNKKELKDLGFFYTGVGR